MSDTIATLGIRNSSIGTKNSGGPKSTTWKLQV